MNTIRTHHMQPLGILAAVLYSANVIIWTSTIIQVST